MIRHEKNFLTGIMFLVVGLGFGLGAFGYSLGNAGRMGPGFFPAALGFLLAILGAVAVFGSLRGDHDAGGAVSRQPLVAVLCVFAAVVAFAILVGGVRMIGLPPMGLGAAIFAAVILASLPGEQFRWREVLILSAILCAFVYGVFVVALDLPLAMLPWFLRS